MAHESSLYFENMGCFFVDEDVEMQFLIRAYDGVRNIKFKFFSLSGPNN
jgi:hypothetical protein